MKLQVLLIYFGKRLAFTPPLLKKSSKFVSRTDDIISDVCYHSCVNLTHYYQEEKESMRKVLLFIVALAIADMLGQIIGLGIAVLG
jgi:hypothetical protein